MRNAREANIPSLYKFPHVFHSFCRDFFANFIPAFPSLTSRDASAAALAVSIGYIFPHSFFMTTLVLRALSLIQPQMMLIRIIWTKTALWKKYVSSFWDSFQPLGPYSSHKTIGFFSPNWWTTVNPVPTDLLNFTCSRNVNVNVNAAIERTNIHVLFT